MAGGHGWFLGGLTCYVTFRIACFCDVCVCVSVMGGGREEEKVKAGVREL